MVFYGFYMGNEHADVLVFDGDFATYDVLSRCLAKSKLSTGLVGSLDELYISLRDDKPHLVVVGDRILNALNVLERQEFAHIPLIVYSELEDDKKIARQHHVPYYEKGRVNPVDLSKEVINELQGAKR